MKITDVAGKKIRISERTITLLNDDEKTAGMVTGVETYYNLSIREKLDIYDEAKKVGLNNWTRLFLIGGAWYYLVDDVEIARAKEFEAIDGKVPQERLAVNEKAAAELGATVIHVARITDSRK